MQDLTKKLTSLLLTLTITLGLFAVIPMTVTAETVEIIDMTSDWKNQVTLTLSRSRQGTEALIVAAYDANNKLVTVKTDITMTGISVTIPITIPSDAVTIKAMLWDSLASIRPLCPSKTLTREAPVTAALTSATADGASNTTTSTKINLVFDKAITGLTVSNITITNDTGAAIIGTLSGSGANWSVSLASVIVQGTVSVAVSSPAGYNISGSPKTVNVYKKPATAVTLLSATADGASNTTTSTKINLVFDKAITGLTASDITITNGTGGAVRGTLSGSGTNWSVTLASVSMQGTVNVYVASPAGYSVSGSPKTVNVYKGATTTVTLLSATADGTSYITTSTKINLKFDKEITGLTSSNITITNVTGKVVKGAVTGFGTDWSIALSSVTAQGVVNVSVDGLSGFIIKNSPLQLAVYKTAVVHEVSTFEQAYSAFRNFASGDTIKLMADIDYGTEIIIGDKNLILDLNGYTLNVDGGPYAALTVECGSLQLKDPANGALNVTGAYGVDVYEGSAEVTNVTAIGANYGVLVEWRGGPSYITVHGSITSTGPNIMLQRTPKMVAELTDASDKPGYLTCSDVDDELRVWVKKPAGTKATLISAYADGIANLVTSTQISLEFDKPITGLTAANITITFGAVKSGLTGSGKNWVINLTEVGSEGYVYLVVTSPQGYIIEGSPFKVFVHSEKSAVYPKEVSIKGDAVLPVNEQYSLTYRTFTANISPYNANVFKDITWTSDKPSVVSVRKVSGTNNVNCEIVVYSVGEANLTATTGNGKTATIKIIVLRVAESLTFYNERQPSGNVRHEMKLGDKIPMYLPTIKPENAYNVLDYKSSAPGVARVITYSNGTHGLEGMAEGEATITATTNNGKTHSFVITVLPKLTNAQLPASHNMEANTYWTPPIAFTPSSGAYPNYTLSSSNTDILRVEENKKVYSISPGTAQIKVSIDGVVQSICTVTVTSPSSNPAPAGGSPSLKYYNVKYAANGKAMVLLGIVPVTGAVDYVITEHVNYTASMTVDDLFAPGNIKTESRVYTAAEAASPINFANVDTGLRYFSIWARSSTGQIGNVFVGRVPVLYHPRNVGGTSQNNAEGFTMGRPWTHYIYGPSGALPYATHLPPYAIALSFDKIPGADGYEIVANCNGKDWGDETLAQPTGNRFYWETGFVFELGDTILNIRPFVYDIDGTTKLYGETRTVTFRVNATSQLYYWETSTSVNDPVLEFNLLQ